MKNILLPLVLLCTNVVSYAQTTATDTAQHITLDTFKVSAKPGPPPYQATTTRVWELINTRIALSFNRKEKTADAREWIKMRPYFYATDTIVLDAKGMRIDSVMLVGKKGNTALQYKYENDALKVNFGRTYIATDTLAIYLRYTAMPYAQKSSGSMAITDDKGLYFINTDNKSPNKPVHIWTQGETEANSHWMITVDKPNTRFTTQIELTVPDSLTTLATGALVKQVKGTNGMRTDIWKMDMPVQAYAVMFAISKYSVIKDKWRGKEANYYVEPEYAPYARQMFKNTPEMLEFFSKKTGVSYPWNKYSQVVVRDYVSGAMENTTASLFGEFMNANTRELADKNNEDVVAHELFHQWFGDYVTCESWTNITVNESFANYGEQLWREWKYGKASRDELAWNDLQIYLATSRAKDPQLVRFNYDSREEVFDGISYNKGGAILHYLNYLIGDAAFEKSMQIYLTKNALHSGEAHNWRLAIEEATGQDWNWFFNQWYFHGGHPTLKVVYNYNDSAQVLTAEVNQTQDDSTMTYILPLKTAVIYGNEKTIVDWKLSKRTETFSFPYKNGVKPIIIPDYAHILPGEIKENKKPAQWLAQYMQSSDYVNKRISIGGAAKSMSDSSTQALIDIALNDSLPSIRIRALTQIESSQSDKYRKRWKNKVMDMAVTDKNNNVRATAFDILGTWKINEAKPAMLQAIWDSSYFVAGNALEALDKIDKDTAYHIAQMIAKTDPKSSLSAATWTSIGKKGADEDIVLLKEKAKTVFGNKVYSFAIVLNGYLKNVASDEAYKTAVVLYTDMVAYETSNSIRAAGAGLMLQAVMEEKGKTKSEDKEVAAKATVRLAILKTGMEKIVNEEDDAEAKTKLEKKVKENFE